MKNKLIPSQNVKDISNKLSKINKKVFIVWWQTRESIIDWNYSWDIDLATDATPDEMKGVLKVVKEVGQKYWTLIVKEWNEFFEITTFRKDIWILDNRKPVEVEFTDSLELDSTRRDFTFNAIYFDVENDNFIDFQGWIDDIENKKIRFIWNMENRINEDALRILRFIRFKNTYAFDNAEENYFEILYKKTHLLKNISIERIKQEFEKILLLENNIQALKDLKEIWFFEHIIPDVDNLEKTPWWPDYHLEWDVWVHTLMTIEQLNIIFKSWFYFYDNEWNEEIIQYNRNDKIVFYWTMLLHDIAKYDTYSLDKNWRVHYYNHETIWNEKFAILSKELHFTKLEKAKISWLIENHLRIFKVRNMKTLKSRKLMMHKYFKDLVVVWISDNWWKIPTSDEPVIKLKEFYRDFMNILKNKVFLTWTDILKKYPDLEWIEIRNKLDAKNDEILLEG